VFDLAWAKVVSSPLRPTSDKTVYVLLDPFVDTQNMLNAGTSPTDNGPCNASDSAELKFDDSAKKFVDSAWTEDSPCDGEDVEDGTDSDDSCDTCEPTIEDYAWSNEHPRIRKIPLKDWEQRKSEDVIHSVSDPPAWVSELDDIVQASIYAIDIILNSFSETKAKETLQRDGGKKQTGKKKSSTPKGATQEKIISALTAHHQYDNGCCHNTTPISGVALAGLSGASRASVSGFFKAHFGGQDKYTGFCSNPKILVRRLKELNGEFSPDRQGGRDPTEWQD